MGLFSKLKKIHKKLDPIGSKLHSKTGGKIEEKIGGKTPLSRMVKGNTSRRKVEGSAVTGGKVTGGNSAAKPTSAVGNVPSKPMQVGGKPTRGLAARAGFNAAGAARLNKLAGGRRNRTK